MIYSYKIVTFSACTTILFERTSSKFLVYYLERANSGLGCIVLFLCATISLSTVHFRVSGN